MPYLGRTPAGAAGNKITGDLKVTGVLSADSISNNIVLDSTDGSANENDNVVMDGTDSDSTNAEDNLLCEENTGDMLVEKRIPTSFGTDGQVFTSTGSTQSAFEDAAGGAWAVLSSGTASSVSQLEFTGIAAKPWKLWILDLVMGTASSLQALFYIDGSLVSSSDYDTHHHRAYDGGQFGITAEDNLAFMKVNPSWNHGTDADMPFAATITCFESGNSSSHPTIRTEAVWGATGQPVYATGYGTNDATGLVTGIRLLMKTGTTVVDFSCDYVLTQLN